MKPTKTTKAKKSAAAPAVPWPASPTPPAAVRAFTPEDDALFARGFPNLHVLLADAGRKPSIAAATKALDAIDPELPVHVAADTARRFVAGHLVGGWTYGHLERGEIVKVPARVTRRKAAIEAGPPLGADTLEAFLVRNCPCGREWSTELDDGRTARGSDNETYGFRLHEIVHLHEAVLGTEPTARLLAEHLLRALADPDSFGFWGQDPFRHNASAHHLACALGTMRWRLAPDVWADVVRPFRGAASERLLVYAQLLASIADERHAEVPSILALGVALLRRDRATIAAHVTGKPRALWNAEIAWLLGGAPFVGLRPGDIRRLPAWKQRRFVDESGRLAMPEIAVLVGMLATSRSARDVACAWLVAHADFAGRALREALPALHEDDRAHAEAALEVVEGAPATSARTLTEEEVDRELRSLFDALEPSLEACEGDVERERAVMRRTFDRYCEARAAAGDVIPDAYFGHELIDWRPKNAAARERWWSLVQEVQER
ncbi:MAG: hypothetical protein IPJ34_04895 [Myxococcales bacterium]|nr:hypothetical protein [Myxococcales bacterium]